MSRAGGRPNPPPPAVPTSPGRRVPAITLSDDCTRCAGLCCVLLAFARSSDFALDKAAGDPCLHLDQQFRCRIHAELTPAGFRGCDTYTCFGAGPAVTHAFHGRNWRSDPSTAPAMSESFRVARQLHEVLWYLRAALAEDVDRLRPALERAALATENAARLAADDLGDFDVVGHRDRVNELLLATSARLRGPEPGPDLRGADLVGARMPGADLRRASLRGAQLMGAELRRADLRRADLTGADLRDTDLRDADLTGALFLTDAQLRPAVGSTGTRLPAGVRAPQAWHQGPPAR